MPSNFCRISICSFTRRRSLYIPEFCRIYCRMHFLMAKLCSKNLTFLFNVVPTPYCCRKLSCEKRVSQCSIICLCVKNTWNDSSEKCNLSYSSQSGARASITLQLHNFAFSQDAMESSFFATDDETAQIRTLKYHTLFCKVLPSSSFADEIQSAYATPENQAQEI